MSDYAPGPWYVEDDRIESDAECHTLATVHPIDAHYFGALSAANARLLAAAPELLEALKEMLLWVDPRVLDRKEFGVAWDQAQVAIRKATEEEQKKDEGATGASGQAAGT